MDRWFWLVFTLAVPLASSTSGRQSTTSTTPDPTTVLFTWNSLVFFTDDQNRSPRASASDEASEVTRASEGPPVASGPPASTRDPSTVTALPPEVTTTSPAASATSEDPTVTMTGDPPFFTTFITDVSSVTISTTDATIYPTATSNTITDGENTATIVQTTASTLSHSTTNARTTGNDLQPTSPSHETSTWSTISGGTTSPPTTAPTTTEPPITAPPTIAPTTTAPPITAPPTTASPTTPPPTTPPPTMAPPTTAPPTSAPLTTPPPTSAPPTTPPPTSAPPTTAPTTTEPPITAPPTTAPPITTLPTTAPPTMAPPTTAPTTTEPPITAPPTTASPTTAPPITTPPTTAPPTMAPPTTAPPSTAPPTMAPPTTAPPTSAPPTTPPPITTPPTSAPPTTAPPITAPPTTAPPTTAPLTTAPPITAPPTTAPPTTAPPTTAPPTTAPPITAPPTTAPPTTPFPTTTKPIQTTAALSSTNHPTATTTTLTNNANATATHITTRSTGYTTHYPPTNGTTMSTSRTTTTTISTTVSSTTHRPTSPPLECFNGGIEENGVCICPDEWTGETCSQENFCNAAQLGKWKFPRTPVGWFAYSEETCPGGTSGEGKPRASARCSLEGALPSFISLQEFRCDQTLEDIQKNLTNATNLENLASSTQILTSKPEELTPQKVTTAAQIANTLLLSPNASQEVRVAAVATVSQLLNTAVVDNAEENNATQGLTLTLDQLSLNLSLNTPKAQVVQPNLVIQSAQIQAADSQGVQFTSLTGASGSFVANRIRLNTNASKVTVENGFLADALVYVRFPPGSAVSSYRKPPNVSLGFVLYQSSRFFPSRLYRRRRATFRVLSASVEGPERSMVPQHVEMLFRPGLLNGTSLHDFSCVFWNYTLRDWSTAGCSKGNTSDGMLRCFCNHTTNFAALWSYRQNYQYAEALGIVSIVGLSFSILGLVVAIIHHIYENFQRKSRERQTNLNSKMSLLCIYISLLAFIITFLSGVQNSSPQSSTPVELSSENRILDSDLHVEPDRGSCTAVTALLHFFLLATFSWNSMYGTQLVLLVRSMHTSLPPYWTRLSVGLGWGVPAVAMAITLAVTYRVDNPLGYRQEEFCWLAALDQNKHFSFGKPMFWAFLLPVGLVLVYNTVLLVLTSLITCRNDPTLKSTRHLSQAKKFLVSFSLSVMLGLSWTLGYFVLIASGPAHLIFSILFCVCTATQGFQIFIFFTARTLSFKASMRNSFQYVSSISIPLNSTSYDLVKSLKKSWSPESYIDLSDRVRRGESSI